MIQGECTTKYIIIPPSEIHFLRFILEGYEGVAVVTTIDPNLGLVRINIAPGCEDDVERVLSAEDHRLMVRRVDFE